MKGHKQKQFVTERSIIKKSLQSLVRQKQQIRIHFLNNHTCQVQKLNHNESSIRSISAQSSIKTSQKPHEIVSHRKIIEMTSSASRQDQSPNCCDNLLEVIHRNRSRMQSIGWHQERPIRRTSNMSRTYRRRRKSHLEGFLTLDPDQYCGSQSKKETLKNQNISINNLELSGFTNQEILKKSALTLTPAQTPKTNSQNGKYQHILAFVKEAKMKRMEFVLPVDKQKCIFEIARNRITQKWKYSLDREEGSKSARQMYRPSLDQNHIYQKLQNDHNSSEKQANKHKQITSINHQHPFLKQIKPLARAQTKKQHHKRILSNFLYSKPQQAPLQISKNQTSAKIEQKCRPWSVFPNYQQKNDQPKQIAQVEHPL